MGLGAEGQNSEPAVLLPRGGNVLFCIGGEDGDLEFACSTACLFAALLCTPVYPTVPGLGASPWCLVRGLPSRGDRIAQNHLSSRLSYPRHAPPPPGGPPPSLSSRGVKVNHGGSQERSV